MEGDEDENRVWFSEKDFQELVRKRRLRPLSVVLEDILVEADLTINLNRYPPNEEQDPREQ